MGILCLAEDSHEISSLILSEKQLKIFKTAVCCSCDWRLKGLHSVFIKITKLYKDLAHIASFTVCFCDSGSHCLFK